MSDAAFYLVARASIIASGDSDDFHHVAPDEVVLVSVESFDRVTRERDEAYAMLECQIDGIPPCHGPGKQDSGMCRACLLSRCRRVEAERDALKAALRDMLKVTSDDGLLVETMTAKEMRNRAREALKGGGK